MTISEIGLLRLRPTASLEDPNIQKRLSEIKSYLNKFTGHTFHYFRQIEDPSLLYLLGQWESLESHYQGMHGSDEWKKSVMEMSNYFEFQWMAHYDFLLDGLRLEDSILQVQRFLMKTPARDEFTNQLKAIPVTSGENALKLRGGWKLDKKEDEEEYAVIMEMVDGQKTSPSSERYQSLGQFAESANRYMIQKFI
ncbi:hypothetical protein NLG97_g4524 [Lecanicillium saksenae]|uniref:Uncharacterized protein n=1 Tax=Lecanicillium saksenae TaxID=468837 RepID=A0ACC1QV21_9HYPO|nr:hypothetical protein NLG97_g4524 [Lecanicillium saksenae]